MNKIAFIFPGQGAQYLGMGKELYQNYPVCRRVFEEAEESLQYKISELIFQGNVEDLNRTENTQPAVVTMSIAALRAFESCGVRADVMAGLSLGEYSALIASEALGLHEAIPLVRLRGKFMQEAVPEGIGKMSAILGLSKELVVEACHEASQYGTVEAANYNCPGQIVIGGEILAVNKASEIAKSLGAKRIVDLPVSAPFHTSMLLPAAKQLARELEKVTIGMLQTPVISNVTGDFMKDSSDIKDLLYRQVMGSVLWEQSMERMINEGVRTFIEFGPGTTLSGFLKKMDRTLTVLHVEDEASLEAAIKGVSQSKED